MVSLMSHVSNANWYITFYSISLPIAAGSGSWNRSGVEPYVRAASVKAVFSWARVKLFTWSMSFIMQILPSIFLVITNERWNERMNSGFNENICWSSISQKIPVTVIKIRFSCTKKRFSLRINKRWFMLWEKKKSKFYRSTHRVKHQINCAGTWIMFGCRQFRQKWNNFLCTIFQLDHFWFKFMYIIQTAIKLLIFRQSAIGCKSETWKITEKSRRTKSNLSCLSLSNLAVNEKSARSW